MPWRKMPADLTGTVDQEIPRPGVPPPSPTLRPRISSNTGMKQLALVCLPALAVLVGSARAQDKADPAVRAAVATDFFSAAKVLTKESFPPQFGLALTASMPTPGWKLTVDRVTKPDAEGRIRLHITGRRPKGMVAQVITPTTVHASLGVLPKGALLIDLHYRSGGRQTYRRVQALVLNAR